MSLFRVFLCLGISASLVACSNGDEDEYSGPSALSGNQKLIVATSVSSVGSLQRAVDVYEDSKAVTPDISDLVELLRPCTVIDTGPDELPRTFQLKGNDCPVSYGSRLELEAGPSLKYTVGYRTSNANILQLNSVKSMNFVVTVTAGDIALRNMSATVELIGIAAPVSVQDKDSISTLPNGDTRFTRFRKMRISGFIVEARALFDLRKIDEDTYGLVDKAFYVNGQEFRSAEEFATIFPEAFDRFEKPSNGPVAP